jgi:hypothetical protein
MRVYHLLSAEHGLSDIALKRIRISRFADLNDPFELLGVSLEDGRQRAAFSNWRADLNTKRGLLCFSKGWESPVLWSHYASKHRGMCLGFDVADTVIEPIRYIKKRVEFKKPSLALMRKLLTSKYSHWRYENEARVFVDLDPATVEDGSYFYPFDEQIRLGSVVLGPLCKLPLAAVRKLARDTYQPGINVIKARLAFKWFSVVPQEQSVTEDYEYWKERPVAERPVSLLKLKSK